MRPVADFSHWGALGAEFTRRTGKWTAGKPPFPSSGVLTVSATPTPIPAAPWFRFNPTLRPEQTPAPVAESGQRHGKPAGSANTTRRAWLSRGRAWTLLSQRPAHEWTAHTVPARSFHKSGKGSSGFAEFYPETQIIRQRFVGARSSERSGVF